ncbi:MAG: acyltransferase family protein [Cyanobacteria bacterium P01_D01_bin.156]
MIWLNNARIVAILAVVHLHVTAVVLSGNYVGSEYWWVGNISSTVVRWCVPVFVMISGALLLDPQKQESSSIFYKKRLSKILIPIGFWSVFFLFWTFLHGFIDGILPSNLQLLKRLLKGLPYEHLWFLYMILGMYLFVPFFRKIISISSDREIVFFTVTTFLIAGINFFHTSVSNVVRPDLFINWFLLYIPFFFSGYLIQKDNRKFPTSVLWSIFLFSAAATAVGYYYVALDSEFLSDSYFHGYLSITVIPMSISVMYLLKEWNIPALNETATKKIALLTFGIYLVHPIVIEVLNKTDYLRAVHPAIAIPTSTAIVFTVSLGISWALYKIPYLNRTI